MVTEHRVCVSTIADLEDPHDEEAWFTFTMPGGWRAYQGGVDAFYAYLRTRGIAPCPVVSEDWPGILNVYRRDGLIA